MAKIWEPALVGEVDARLISSWEWKDGSRKIGIGD